MNKLQKIKNSIKKFVTSPRFNSLAVMLLVGTVACLAQNTAGNYEAGTTALTTVSEENAFWLNHTKTKYDKMNIKLKKTRYK